MEDGRRAQSARWTRSTEGGRGLSSKEEKCTRRHYLLRQKGSGVYSRSENKKTRTRGEAVQQKEEKMEGGSSPHEDESSSDRLRKLLASHLRIGRRSVGRRRRGGRAHRRSAELALAAVRDPEGLHLVHRVVESWQERVLERLECSSRAKGQCRGTGMRVRGEREGRAD